MEQRRDTQIRPSRGPHGHKALGLLPPRWSGCRAQWRLHEKHIDHLCVCLRGVATSLGIVIVESTEPMTSECDYFGYIHFDYVDVVGNAKSPVLVASLQDRRRMANFPRGFSWLRRCRRMVVTPIRLIAKICRSRGVCRLREFDDELVSRK